MSLLLTPLPDIHLIRTGDDLPGLTLAALQRAGISLQDGDILVFAQKVISKAEGRMIDLTTVTPSPRARELAGETGKDPRLLEMVLQESNMVLRTRFNSIIVEHHLGFVCANAGIDHSNVSPDLQTSSADWILLLPKDPDASAARLRAALEQASGARLGILIIDSHGRAWRLGTIGMAIGLSGLPGVADLRGEPDLFGFRLQITQVGVADELAAAASLVMGQADEGTPIVHARGFPYPLREGNLTEILRPRETDMFR